MTRNRTRSAALYEEASLGPTDPESTFQLIERARAGDGEALERLFRRHLAP